jgi:hypothetical protein
MKTIVDDIIVLSKVMDGGPVVCGSCITAWRPTAACPNCGCTLSNAEQNTERCHRIYKLQRENDAPDVRSSDWLGYLETHGISVMW